MSIANIFSLLEYPATAINEFRNKRCNMPWQCGLGSIVQGLRRF